MICCCCCNCLPNVTCPAARVHWTRAPEVFLLVLVKNTSALHIGGISDGQQPLPQAQMLHLLGPTRLVGMAAVRSREHCTAFATTPHVVDQQCCFGLPALTNCALLVISHHCLLGITKLAHYLPVMCAASSSKHPGEPPRPAGYAVPGRLEEPALCCYPGHNLEHWSCNLHVWLQHGRPQQEDTWFCHFMAGLRCSHRSYSLCWCLYCRAAPLS